MHVAQSGIFAIQADRDEEQAVSVGLFIRRLTESPKGSPQRRGVEAGPG